MNWGSIFSRQKKRYLCKCGYSTDYVEEYGDHRAEEMDDVAHYNVLNKDPDYNKNPTVIPKRGLTGTVGD